MITENHRVLQAVQVLESGDAAGFGALINQSHASLRHDFEVSREELDLIVALAQAQPGCYGARMTGAGFGGCAVALVDNTHVANFVTNVADRYEEASGLKAQIYICQATAGAQVVVDAT